MLCHLLTCVFVCLQAPPCAAAWRRDSSEVNCEDAEPQTVHSPKHQPDCSTPSPAAVGGASVLMMFGFPAAALTRSSLRVHVLDCDGCRLTCTGACASPPTPRALTPPPNTHQVRLGLHVEGCVNPFVFSFEFCTFDGAAMMSR